jgi:hypothetical protein
LGCTETPEDESANTCTQTDGIWTGVDWVDEDNSYQVVNGILEGTSTEAIRRIASARNLDGDGSDYLSLTNVQRAMQVLTQSLWDEFFPDALAVYTY